MDFRQFVRPFFAPPKTPVGSISKHTYDVLGWIITQCSIAFITVPYLTSKANETIQVWASVYVSITSTILLLIFIEADKVDKVLGILRCNHYGCLIPRISLLSRYSETLDGGVTSVTVGAPEVVK
ncbi:MAG: lysophospholipid acyltransferase [Trichoglossum hirsutum]|nr:MAG: lysophospholipid acyltransferase [Trichoglossum hirsutum]